MAKTMDQIVMEQLGGLTLTVARLQAELEAAREEIAQLKAAATESKPVVN